MTSFTAVRKQIDESAQHNDMDDLLDKKYLLCTLYFSMLSYFKLTTIERRLEKLGAKYISIYSFGDAHAVLAEFDTFVIVAFKGTEFEGMTHLKTGFTFWKSEFLGEYVHTGFLNVITRLGRKIENDLEDIDPSKKVIYTGHSLGGALSLLMAMKYKPNEIVTYGAPKVSGDSFCSRIDGVKITRVYNKFDIVSYIPPNIPGVLNYRHYGEEVMLQGDSHPIKTHKLKVYLREILKRYNDGGEDEGS